MKLAHLGITFYRSIGAEPVMIDLSKKITVLVGANNCGKSNVLRALERVCSKRDQEVDFGEIDYHQRSRSKLPRFQLTAIGESADGDALLGLGSFTLGWNGYTFRRNESDCTDFDRLEFPEFNTLLARFASERYNARVNRDKMRLEYPKVAQGLVEALRPQIPQSCLIPQFREIRSGEAYSINGGGIVKLLASWQHPAIGRDGDYEKYKRVRDLLRKLTQLPDVGMEVSHQQDEIIVRRGELRLPLSAFGTGLHELIILAIAVLSQSNALVCIEEPEIHLHPLLQRRFVEFLRTDTDNRYVITTHSPALIAPGIDTDVIHLWLENGITRSRHAETAADSLQALRDLGVRASDLLQANSVIWVEGPSDRIYLNRWINLLDQELQEGIDYSIMFYGGRLLSHLSLDRDAPADADDLIQLLRINQYSAILIDSDRRSASSDINATKTRVRAECETAKVPCWITDGKEIENSLPPEAIATVYRELSGSVPKAAFTLDQYELLEESLHRWFGADWKDKWSYDIAKPKMARAIVQHITKENMGQVVEAECLKLIALIKHQTVGIAAPILPGRAQV